jgi:hypothetical protein
MIGQIESGRSVFEIRVSPRRSAGSGVVVAVIEQG